MCLLRPKPWAITRSRRGRSPPTVPPPTPSAPTTCSPTRIITPFWVTVWGTETAGVPSHRTTLFATRRTTVPRPCPPRPWMAWVTLPIRQTARPWRGRGAWEGDPVLTRVSGLLMNRTQQGQWPYISRLLIKKKGKKNMYGSAVI